MDAITPIHELTPGALSPDRPTNCRQCGEAFEPRKGSGGRPQRFCGVNCRAAFHATAEPSQRAPTCDAQTTLALTGQPPETDATSDDFDWSSDASVITPEQLAVAAYFNTVGDLVIRQAAWYHDDDAVVVVQRGNVAAFIDKLCDVIGIPGSPR